MPLYTYNLHKVVVDGIEDGALRLVSLSFDETMNEGFVLDATVASRDPDLDIEDLIGKTITVDLGDYDAAGEPVRSVRFLHGIILEGEWTGDDLVTRADAGEFSHAYRLRAGSFFDLGRFRTDSKVFTDKPPIEIIKEVLAVHAKGYGEIDVADGAGSTPVFEHFVQYREPDNQFCRRLMEHYGICSFFEMQSGLHKMVFFERNGSVFSRVETVDFAAEPDDAPLFHSFTRRRSFRTSAVEMADYDQFRPNSQQTEFKSDLPTYGKLKWEEFSYPAGYPDGIDRAKIVERRLDAIKSESEAVSAVCTSIEIKVGQRFKLENCPTDSMNVEWIVTSVSLALGDAPADGGAEDDFSIRATLVPDAIAISPRKTIGDPQSPGIVTARVVDGSENDPGAMGRIRVHYPFVREADSFWCRVAQSWAGPGLGTWVNHRVGHEVVIAFEHGDVNRPIVMGSVYNGENGNPYIGELGDEVSGWRSQSPGGFNEIMFRDKDGDELFNMVAQKNMTVNVLNDETVAIGNDASKSVGGNTSLTTAGKTHVHSDGEIMIDTPAKITLQCGGSTVTITPGSIEMVTQQMINTAGATIVTTAGASIATTAGASIATTAGTSVSTIAGSDIAMEAGDNLAAVAAKNMSMTADKVFNVAKEMAVNVDDKFSLASKKVAQITADGDITVKGKKKINVSASGKAIVKGQKVEMN